MFKLIGLIALSFAEFIICNYFVSTLPFLIAILIKLVIYFVQTKIEHRKLRACLSILQLAPIVPIAIYYKSLIVFPISLLFILVKTWIFEPNNTLGFFSKDKAFIKQAKIAGLLDNAQQMLVPIADLRDFIAINKTKPLIICEKK